MPDNLANCVFSELDEYVDGLMRRLSKIEKPVRRMNASITHGLVTKDKIRNKDTSKTSNYLDLPPPPTSQID